MARRRKAAAPDPGAMAFEAGMEMVHRMPLFRPLLQWSYVRRRSGSRCPDDGWAVVDSNGAIDLHPKRRGLPEEWAWVVAHCLLHLGFGHLRENEDLISWNAACDLVVNRFLSSLSVGRPPDDVDGDTDLGGSEESTAKSFHEKGIPTEARRCGTAGRQPLDMILVSAPRHRFGANPDWPRLFAQGVALAVKDAVRDASVSGRSDDESEDSAARRARRWFIESYPLLGAVAARFRIIEDPAVCGRSGISVAAVQAELGEIYLNPAAGLDDEQCRFVIAHELLHASLGHHARCRGRDPFFWNVACDYVINGWLHEMRVGTPPAFGLLHDPQFKGASAEQVYDRIVTELRRYRKSVTFRGIGTGDMLPGSRPGWWNNGDGLELDEFCRSALAQGLEYHRDLDRGLLPADLVEEIRALSQPPIAWDVELARWFDRHFPPTEKRRSYARPSRRQSAAPDIPLPRWSFDTDRLPGRTFGVILDTSWSMDRALLAQALGAIASYSFSRDIPAVRLVYVDAQPYDEGYVPPERIADRLDVKGRGGTVIQPAIDFLERAHDFPPDGPILIITDGACDRLRITREHAFLIPRGAGLPFPPKGEVFRVE